MVLCNADESPDKERRYLDAVAEERVAGVLLSPTGTTVDLDALRRGGTPVVAVDRPLDGVDPVLVDTRAAAAGATTHLLDAGYRRIGCVTGPAGIRTADDRLDGFPDALRAAGAEARPGPPGRVPRRGRPIGHRGPAGRRPRTSTRCWW